MYDYGIEEKISSLECVRCRSQQNLKLYQHEKFYSDVVAGLYQAKKFNVIVPVCSICARKFSQWKSGLGRQKLACLLMFILLISLIIAGFLLQEIVLVSAILIYSAFALCVICPIKSRRAFKSSLKAEDNPEKYIIIAEDGNVYIKPEGATREILYSDWIEYAIQKRARGVSIQHKQELSQSIISPDIDEFYNQKFKKLKCVKCGSRQNVFPFIYKAEYNSDYKIGKYYDLRLSEVPVCYSCEKQFLKWINVKNKYIKNRKRMGWIIFCFFIFALALLTYGATGSNVVIFLAQFFFISLLFIIPVYILYILIYRTKLPKREDCPNKYIDITEQGILRIKPENSLKWVSYKDWVASISMEDL